MKLALAFVGGAAVACVGCLAWFVWAMREWWS